MQYLHLYINMSESKNQEIMRINFFFQKQQSFGLICQEVIKKLFLFMILFIGNSFIYYTKLERTDFSTCMFKYFFMKCEFPE